MPPEDYKEPEIKPGGGPVPGSTHIKGGGGDGKIDPDLLKPVKFGPIGGDGVIDPDLDKPIEFGPIGGDGVIDPALKAPGDRIHNEIKKLEDEISD